MIIDKKLIVKITKLNINHFLVYFPNISLKDLIEIDVELHLQKKSNLKLNVSCDICNVQRYIKYQAYTKNINSCPEHPIYTCDKCSHIKLKTFNLKNYGVEYYSQHPDRNDKVKKTTLEKYGVDHFSKTDLYKEKISKTNLERYGVENPFMDSKKIKESFIKKYGVDHPSKVKEISEKIKKTTLDKYGYDNVFKSPEIRKQINNTIELKYGGHHFKNETIRLNNMKISKDKNYLSYIDNRISLFKCDIGKEHNFEITCDLYHNRIRSKLPLCTICYPLNENVSIKEKELGLFIKENYSNEIIFGYKDKIEIDIYLPDLKIGFEFNGLYWHSEVNKSKNYHLEKTNYFKDKGINIIHIWEDDWDYKTDIVKSMILNRLGKNNQKIYGRKCIIKEVSDNNIIRNFLEENHIQGYCPNQKKIGLYYNDILVSLMCFNKFEGRKKLPDTEWNLSRFCNLKSTNVIGGASKLLKYFIEENKPSRIISYADKDWSVGNLYYQMGFSNIKESNVDYKYIINDKRVHKQNFKKSNLKLDESVTESNYMKSNNYYKIWDCGKIKFEKLYKNN